MLQLLAYKPSYPRLPSALDKPTYNEETMEVSSSYDATVSALFSGDYVLYAIIGSTKVASDPMSIIAISKYWKFPSQGDIRFKTDYNFPSYQYTAKTSPVLFYHDFL